MDKILLDKIGQNWTKLDIFTEKILLLVIYSGHLCTFVCKNLEKSMGGQILLIRVFKTKLALEPNFSGGGTCPYDHAHF